MRPLPAGAVVPSFERSANPELVFVVDHGAIKLYRLERSGGAVLRLGAEWTIPAGRGRYADEFTDQAGRFPDVGSGGNGNSAGERLNFEAERRERSVRLVATTITERLNGHTGNWHLAVPAAMKASLMKKLAPELRENLKSCVDSDLVKVPPGELLAHFDF